MAMEKATLDFEIEDRGEIRVIHVSGPLDSMTFDACKAYLDPIINQTRVRIVLDCENLTYVNSHGVALLMYYQQTATRGFSFFGIAALRPHTIRNIELLGLGKMLARYPTLEEAVQMAVAM
jgi:anti-sigma B factor antagonist